MKDHHPALDGLRGIAVLMVLWWHVSSATRIPVLGALELFLEPGYLGVNIFFVLSGFLIARILLVDRQRGVPLRYFLARRALRIFPIYYLTLLIVGVLRHSPEMPWCVTYLSNFYFCQKAHNAGPLRHTWSLSVEEQFYLLWPPAVYFLSAAWSRRMAWGMLPVAVAAAAATCIVHPAAGFIYMGSVFRFASLGAGALLAFAEPSIRALGPRMLAPAFAGAVAALALIHVPRWTLDDAAYIRWFPAAWLVGFGLLSTSIVVLVIAWRDAEGGAARLLAVAPLRAVGRISYGLYLYHFPIYIALGVYEGAASGWVAAGAVALSFAAAGVSFYVIERPLMKLQDRFRGSSRAAWPAPRAADAGLATLAAS